MLLCRAFFNTPRRKSSNVPTSSRGLNLSRLKSGVFSVDESLAKVSANGFADPGGDRVPGLFTGGLIGAGPAERLGIAWMLTLRAVCIGAYDAAMPNPPPPCPWTLFATSPSSCSSYIVSTAVASLWKLEYSVRGMGGLVGGEMCVSPKEWELSTNCRPGRAGVLPALSDRSDVSFMRGRRSAITPRKGEGFAVSLSSEMAVQPPLLIVLSQTAPQQGCVVFGILLPYSCATYGSYLAQDACDAVVDDDRVDFMGHGREQQHGFSGSGVRTRGTSFSRRAGAVLRWDRRGSAHAVCCAPWTPQAEQTRPIIDPDGKECPISLGALLVAVPDQWKR